MNRRTDLCKTMFLSLRLSFLWVVVLLPAQFTYAQESEWNFGADFKMGQTIFPYEYASETNTSFFKLELNPNARLKYGDHWRIYFRPTFIANPDNMSDQERYFFDPTEAYIKFQGDNANIQVGYNIFTWGVTDGYNPVDIVNTKQIFDPLQGKKLGALSVWISQSTTWFDYDLIYIPRSRASILPGEKSRWLPREVFVPQVADNNLVLLLPNELRYHYGERDVLNLALDHNYALRLQKTISIFDISLSGYEGVAAFPIIEPNATGSIVQVSPKTIIQIDSDVYLNTKDYRIRQGGFSIVSQQWDFLFKFQTSYSQSLGNYVNLPGWTHESVVGLEKTFSIPRGNLIGILQHSFLNTERKNDSNISIAEIFRSAWMLGGRWTWNEVWSGSVLTLYDTVHQSHFEQITFSRRFFDTWTLTGEAIFISGTSQNPLGLYSQNDSYSLSLSRSF